MAAACPTIASLQPETDYAALGKVTTMGPREAWQVALLFPQPFTDPSNYQDLRAVHQTFNDGPVGTPSAYLLTVHTRPEVRFGPPRLAVKLADDAGNLRSSVAFGELESLKKLLPAGAQVLVVGKRILTDSGEFFSIEDIVPAAWKGRLRPKYPGNGKVIGAAMVRERVLKQLRRAVPRAAAFIEAELSQLHDPANLLRCLGAAGSSALELLQRAHLPRTPEEGIHAQGILERVAALVALWKAHRNRPSTPVKKRLTLSTLHQRMWAIPQTLTEEQCAAAMSLAKEIEGEYPARCILMADVGSGKSFVYQAVLAAAVDAGANVLVMLPNFPMAAQAAAEIAELYPDLHSQLVTGETDAKIALAGIPVLIGTTALLHRDAGPRQLVVVDEQQRFNVAQREAYVREGTHLIEVSATCIPRTQALVAYGVVSVAKLTRPHTPKTLHTRFWQVAEKHALFADLCKTVAGGGRAFIIYPARGDGGADKESADDIHNVRAAALLWETRFPGRVRTLTGVDDNVTKRAVLDDMRGGRADLLIATSVVEIGINVPNLRRVLVIGAESFGLTTLHQMRGRLAREGGEGHFDLYCPEPPPETALERFAILCRTSDGFEVAEADLRRRGFGDLAPGASRQTGADQTLLYGRPISLDVADAILPVFAALSARGEKVKSPV